MAKAEAIGDVFLKSFRMLIAFLANLPQRTVVLPEVHKIPDELEDLLIDKPRFEASLIKIRKLKSMEFYMDRTCIDKALKKADPEAYAKMSKRRGQRDAAHGALHLTAELCNRLN